MLSCYHCIPIRALCAKKYKDVQFSINAVVTKIKLTFMKNAWPSDLQKSSIKDKIDIELKLNKDI